MGGIYYRSTVKMHAVSDRLLMDDYKVALGKFSWGKGSWRNLMKALILNTNKYCKIIYTYNTFTSGYIKRYHHDYTHYSENTLNVYPQHFFGILTSTTKKNWGGGGKLLNI